MVGLVKIQHCRYKVSEWVTKEGFELLGKLKILQGSLARPYYDKSFPQDVFIKSQQKTDKNSPKSFDEYLTNYTRLSEDFVRGRYSLPHIIKFLKNRSSSFPSKLLLQELACMLVCWLCFLHTNISLFTNIIDVFRNMKALSLWQFNCFLAVFYFSRQ